MKNCVIGIPCGNTCINRYKKCRKSPFDDKRESFYYRNRRRGIKRKVLPVLLPEENEIVFLEDEIMERDRRKRNLDEHEEFIDWDFNPWDAGGGD